MLRVARKLGEKYPVTVMPTFLGAHALPPEYEGKSDQYVYIQHPKSHVFVNLFVQFSRLERYGPITIQPQV